MSRLAPFRWAAVACVAACLIVASAAKAGAFRQSAHGNAGVLPQGCGSCHLGHGSPQTKMFPGSQVTACLTCHGDPAWQSAAQARGILLGPLSSANIAAEFSKTSHHPLAEFAPPPTVSTTFARSMPVAPVSPSAVVCSDCHDPHYLVKSARGGASDATSPKLVTDSRGNQKPESAICLRCHGAGATVDIQRLIRSSNPSYHPVEAPGRNPTVPSLIAPYTAQSYVACTDCHGSDQASILGPHGSTFAPILKASFAKDDGHAESAYEYALCYRCHSRSVVLSSASFPEHRRHVVEERVSCHTCHDSHGSAVYPHLISFDPRTVFSNSGGELSYQSLGPQRGRCSLLCHGEDHVQEEY